MSTLKVVVAVVVAVVVVVAAVVVVDVVAMEVAVAEAVEAADALVIKVIRWKRWRWPCQWWWIGLNLARAISSAAPVIFLK